MINQIIYDLRQAILLCDDTKKLRGISNILSMLSNQVYFDVRYLETKDRHYMQRDSNLDEMIDEAIKNVELLP
jgi:hypothetical protein